jgi:alginate O-acetyltransferase complex protein AlgI
MVGLFKKLLIVNYLTVNITDDVFIVPQNHGSLVVLLAILAYVLVIYLDLSSYSDMAIGFAGLLGFWLPVNFDAPYSSLTIQEFWRKWHITLSNWVRDYIYIPLGGNRKAGSGRAQTLSWQ